MPETMPKKRGRPTTPRLTRDAIGREAVAMLAETGDLTLPGLAARMDVRPSAFYKHVSGRAEIIELARGALVEKVPALDLDDPELTLEQVVRRLFRMLVAAFSAVPALTPLLFAQPVSDPTTLAVYDRAARRLIETGMPQPLVLPFIETLDTIAAGAAIDKLAPTSAWQIPEDRHGEFATLVSVQTTADDIDPVAVIEDVLTTGILHRVAQTTAPTSH
ncbi:TetR/AcrR family transcriptional regulator [Microbacterium mangrovi]|uniref:TetR/AcrR family transcriptional regulator n=1 Tax=Microbacterium mangrovi TaxID=1348253 RepID=UPI00069207D8|nr:TetR/AcrR family transcriptional regulator C-terminal domain-containing protein [Microbacterium mangrovi]